MSPHWRHTRRPSHIRELGFHYKWDMTQIVGMPPVFCVTWQLILAEVLLSQKDQIIYVSSGALCLRQAIHLDCQNLCFAFLIRAITKIFIQVQLHDDDSDTCLPCQSPDSLAQIFYHILQLLDEFWHMNALKTYAVYLPGGHNFRNLRVAAIHITSYNLYSVHKTSDCNHDSNILISEAKHHDTVIPNIQIISSTSMSVNLVFQKRKKLLLHLDICHCLLRSFQYNLYR